MANESTSTLSTVTSTVTSALVGMVKDGVGFLADLLSRIVNGIKGIAPVVLAAGCSVRSGRCGGPAAQGGRADRARPTPKIDEEPKQLGDFKITFYYMIGEDEVATRTAARAAKKAKQLGSKPANDNHASDPVGELASIAVPELVTVYEGGLVRADRRGHPGVRGAARAPGDRQAQGRPGHQRLGPLQLRAIALLQGHLHEVGHGRDRPRPPAVPDGRGRSQGREARLLLHVPLLEGRMMPGRAPWGGFIHDGCVVADDTGGGIKGKQIDLFVGRRGYFLGMSGHRGSHAWARKVPVFDGTKLCERKGRRVARRSGSI